MAFFARSDELAAIQGMLARQRTICCCPCRLMLRHHTQQEPTATNTEAPAKKKARREIESSGAISIAVDYEYRCGI